jgi:hypothetical protein
MHRLALTTMTFVSCVALAMAACGDDATSPVTGGGSSQGGDGGSAAMGGGGSAPQEESLQGATFETCTEPLWCILNADITDPISGAIWAQECFEATLPPPFTVTHVRYVIAAVTMDLGAVELEVRGPLPDDPAISGSVLLEDEFRTVGDHLFELPEPIVVNTSRFCVGLAGTSDQGALGVAVDTDSVDPDTSYVKSDACNTLEFTDLTTIATSVPPVGNWCIAVDIAK